MLNDLDFKNKKHPYTKTHLLLSITKRYLKIDQI